MKHTLFALVLSLILSLIVLPCCLSEAFTNQKEAREQVSDSALTSDPSLTSDLSGDDKRVSQDSFSAVQVSDAVIDIPSMDEEPYVVPNVKEYLTLRSGSGGTIDRILSEERMRVLGWSGTSCLVERERTKQVGYVNSGYIMAEGLQTDRWPYDYETLIDDLDHLPEGPPIATEALAQTADGRDIIVVRYGDDQAGHHILIQCAMHAREIMTARLGGDLIQMLLKDFPYGIEDFCIHIVPLVNPDGQVIALYGPEALQSETLAASVRQMLGKNDHSDWKANALGVDINRNFDAGWQSLSGREAGWMRYRGPEPHSEVESRALVDYVNRYPFDCTISIHSFGSKLYWMGATGDLAQRTKSLADRVRESTGYEPVFSENDVEKGGFKDWALEKAGIPSLTIEIGALDSIGSLAEYSAIALRFRSLIPNLVDWVGSLSAE